MSCFRNNDAPAPSKCSECSVLKTCGGWDDQRADQGCFQRCEECFNNLCDHACPLNPILYDLSCDDVGGLCKQPAVIKAMNQEEMPCYLPQVYHGARRVDVLREPWVAIPLHYVTSLTKNGKISLLKVEDGEALRSKLRLASETRIILTSVCPDRYIESFWEQRKKGRFLEQMANWNLLGMTTPNHSFVLDAPRTNSLWNLTRIFRWIEEISNVGISAIPHLQAQTKADWSKWRSACDNFPAAKHFAMEFQTGLGNSKSKTVARQTYMGHFEDLQQSCGRRIHPIVLAGCGMMKWLSDTCESYTIVDSTPFVKTLNRQRAFRIAGTGLLRWRTIESDPKEDLSGRLQESIDRQKQHLFFKNQMDQNGRPFQQPLISAA